MIGFFIRSVEDIIIGVVIHFSGIPVVQVIVRLENLHAPSVKYFERRMCGQSANLEEVVEAGCVGIGSENIRDNKIREGEHERVRCRVAGIG